MQSAVLVGINKKYKQQPTTPRHINAVENDHYQILEIFRFITNL